MVVNNKKKSETYKSDKPGILAYDYLIKYFGGDKYKDKLIIGSSVQLAIHVYKNGEEIKFSEEPKTNNTFLYEVYNVSFDREKLFEITKIIPVDYMFRVELGWDEIKAEVVGYSLYYESEIRKNMPEIMKNPSYWVAMEVTENEFKEFISSHQDGFDIVDNIVAQVSSVSYINKE